MERHRDTRPPLFSSSGRYTVFVTVMKDDYVSQARDYGDTCEYLREVHDVDTVELLKRVDVIGMTITCASRMLNVLRAVKCPVVLVGMCAPARHSFLVAFGPVFKAK